MTFISSLRDLYLLFCAGIDDVYEKYYRFVPREVFDRFLEIDPSNKKRGNPKGQKGDYTDWLCQKFKQKNLKIEDIEKVEDLLKAFYEGKRELQARGLPTDINKYKTVQDLAKVLDENRDLKKPDPDASKEQDTVTNRFFVSKGEADIVYEDSKWLVVTPKSYEASKFYALNTNWCTRYPDWYARYSKESPLVIFILKDKVDTSYVRRKVQYHAGKYTQLKDVSDSEISYFDFKQEIPPSLLKSLFNVDEIKSVAHANKKEAGISVFQEKADNNLSSYVEIRGLLNIWNFLDLFIPEGAEYEAMYTLLIPDSWEEFRNGGSMEEWPFVDDNVHWQGVLHAFSFKAANDLWESIKNEYDYELGDEPPSEDNSEESGENEERNPFWGYTSMSQMFGSKERFLSWVVGKCEERGTTARRIRQIFDDIYYYSQRAYNEANLGNVETLLFQALFADFGSDVGFEVEKIDGFPVSNYSKEKVVLVLKSVSNEVDAAIARAENPKQPPLPYQKEELNAMTYDWRNRLAEEHSWQPPTIDQIERKVDPTDVHPAQAEVEYVFRDLMGSR